MHALYVVFTVAWLASAFSNTINAASLARPRAMRNVLSIKKKFASQFNQTENGRQEETQESTLDQTEYRNDDAIGSPFELRLLPSRYRHRHSRKGHCASVKPPVIGGGLGSSFTTMEVQTQSPISMPVVVVSTTVSETTTSNASPQPTTTITPEIVNTTPTTVELTSLASQLESQKPSPFTTSENSLIDTTEAGSQQPIPSTSLTDTTTPVSPTTTTEQSTTTPTGTTPKIQEPETDISTELPETMLVTSASETTLIDTTEASSPIPIPSTSPTTAISSVSSTSTTEQSTTTQTVTTPEIQEPETVISTELIEAILVTLASETTSIDTTEASSQHPIPCTSPTDATTPGSSSSTTKQSTSTSTVITPEILEPETDISTELPETVLLTSASENSLIHTTEASSQKPISSTAPTDATTSVSLSTTTEKSTTTSIVTTQEIQEPETDISTELPETMSATSASENSLIDTSEASSQQPIPSTTLTQSTTTSLVTTPEIEEPEITVLTETILAASTTTLELTTEESSQLTETPATTTPKPSTQTEMPMPVTQKPPKCMGSCYQYSLFLRHFNKKCSKTKSDDFNRTKYRRRVNRPRIADDRFEKLSWQHDDFPEY